MNVFISYSRDDSAIAHLLAYILTSNGIQCELDRQIRVGEDFHVEIQEMIRRADVVLVLMTNSAVMSPWVNHEIGFSMALGKEIRPVVMEADIQPSGMLSNIQSISLFDWTEPSRSIERLIDTLKRSVNEDVSPFEVVGLDGVLYGKIRRTEFLVDYLQKLRDVHTSELVVLNQAAFTIFAASNDPVYGPAGGHSLMEMKLLMQEREAFERLVDAPNVTLQFLLWPKRSYEKAYLELRFRTLLEWMRNTRDNPRVSYACSDIPVPNRLIVVGQASIEGAKHQHTANYDVTVVKRQRHEVEQAESNFRETFERSYRGNDSTISQIEEMYAELRT